MRPTIRGSQTACRCPFGLSIVPSRCLSKPQMRKQGCQPSRTVRRPKDSATNPYHGQPARHARTRWPWLADPVPSCHNQVVGQLGGSQLGRDHLGQQGPALPGQRQARPSVSVIRLPRMSSSASSLRKPASLRLTPRASSSSSHTPGPHRHAPSPKHPQHRRLRHADPLRHRLAVQA